MIKATKTESGKYRTKVAYYDLYGNRKFKSFTDENELVAVQQAIEWKLMHKNNTATPSYGNLTLNDACERYINSKSAVCSPSTIAGYERIRKNRFKMIMKIRLEKLTFEMVQIAVDELALDHSPKTVINSFSFINSVLKVYDQGLDLSRITLPAKQRVEIFVPTTAEVNRLLEVADEWIRIPILLASQGSLRRSEICALTLDDVKDTGISINKAVVEDKEGEDVLKSTKTYAGTRFVPLSQNLLKELRAWQHFGLSPKTLTNRWYSLFRKNGLESFRFHSLRHYFASECHANGVPDQYICEIGGWESPLILQRIYQHTLRDKKTQFSEKIINIFSENFNNGQNDINKAVHF